jgi:hypothetical protein
MRLRLTQQPPAAQMPNALDPLPLVVPTIGVHGSHLDQICRVHRLLLVDRNCSLSQVGDEVQVLFWEFGEVSHISNTLKKFFLMQGMQMGVKYRSSSPRRRDHQGGARPDYLACGLHLSTGFCPQLSTNSCG